MGMPVVPPQAKLPGDAAVFGSVVAVWMGYLPTALAVIASVLSITWLALQIYAWFEARRKNKRADPE